MKFFFAILFLSSAVIPLITNFPTTPLPTVSPTPLPTDHYCRRTCNRFCNLICGIPEE